MNPLTRDIGIYLKIEQRGELIRKYLTPELMKTCGHLRIINAIFDQAKPAMAEKLRSVLLDDETVRSFLFEVDIATHFFARGLDVQFVDLQSSGNFDLLVSNDERALEIECKTKSADAGRKIIRPNFYLLCDVLTAELSPLTESFALLFKCDGRLTGSQDFFYRVAEEVQKCRVQQQSHGGLGVLSFELRNLPPGTAIKTHEEAAYLLAPHGSVNAHYFALSGPQTLVIACESTDANRVLKSIYEDLKRGASQLSRTRPSILACQLEDIDDEDWSQLQSESGLAAMSRRLLSSSDRRHINFVVYSSTKTPPNRDGAITSFSTTTLRFENTNAEYPFPAAFLLARRES